MEKKQLIELRKQAKVLTPVTRIGKNGLTEAVVKEIIKQLNKKKLIKVKFLRPLISDKKSKKELAAELVEKTKSELVELVGFSVTIYKNNPNLYQKIKEGIVKRRELAKRSSDKLDKTKKI